jgi:hypothetical protein
MKMKCKIILLSIDQCICHCNNVNQKHPATETLPNVQFLKTQCKGQTRRIDKK